MQIKIFESHYLEYLIIFVKIECVRNDYLKILEKIYSFCRLC